MSLYSVGMVLLLISGGALFVWSALLATNSRLQQWNYHRTEGKWPEIGSKEYQTALIHMRIAGSRAALIGGLMMVFALTQLGFLD
jgi:hypothetical protein